MNTNFLLFQRHLRTSAVISGSKPATCKIMKKTIVITGPVHSGKTTFIQETLTALSGEYNISGFYSPKYYENRIFKGYDLVDIESGESSPFIRMEETPGWRIFGRFHFNPEAFVRGSAVIAEAKEADILIMDEIGPLEIQGEGFIEGLRTALSDYDGIFIIVCRDYILEPALKIIGEAGKTLEILRPEKWDELTLMLINQHNL